MQFPIDFILIWSLFREKHTIIHIIQQVKWSKRIGTIANHMLQRNLILMFILRLLIDAFLIGCS